MCKKQVHLFKRGYKLIITKIRLKIKNRSHRHDINWPRPRHGHKYTKYKMCLRIMTAICNKQHLKVKLEVKQHWGWVEKKHCL